MTDPVDPKADAAAEKAYEAAAADRTSAPEKDKNQQRAPEAGAGKKPEAPAVKAPAKRKPAAKKQGPSIRKIAAAVAADPAPKAPRKIQPTRPEPKETTMANTDTNDFTATTQAASADIQSRMKAAYDKSAEMTSQATEFTKGNVEAVVESGKILAGGMQDLGRTAVEDTKTAFETLTADIKKMAAVKSPTELFQLQSEIARRNFDAMVGYSSKNAEKVVKLANDAFAPISSRVSVAAEKVSQAA